MRHDAILNQLGYAPNDALLEQMQRIIDNTHGFEKIEKRVFDLQNVLKVDDSYVAMSNSNDYFKIKIEASTPEHRQEALKKVTHFSQKYKVGLEKVEGKDTYYILGYEK